MKAKNIITAMKMSGLTGLSEGRLYEILIKNFGLSGEDATSVVKDMLDTGKVKRNGCAILLTQYADNHDTEHLIRSGVVNAS